MYLNDAGEMVEITWNQIPDFFHGVEIDAFQVMTNHIHGIVVLVGATPCGCPELGNDKPPIKYKMHQDHFIDHKTGHEQKQTGQTRKAGQPQGVAPTLSLSNIVHRSDYYKPVVRNGIDAVNKKSWVHCLENFLSI